MRKALPIHIALGSLWGFLFVILQLLGFAVAGYAIEAPSLSLSKSDRGKSLIFEIAVSAEAVSCQVSINAATRKKRLKKKIAEQTNVISGTTTPFGNSFHATDVPTVRLAPKSLRKRATFYFAALLSCGDEEVSSNIVRLRVRRSRKSGAVALKKWLQNLGELLDDRSLALKVAFPELAFANPVDLQNASDGSGRVFVVEQRGLVKVFDSTNPMSSETYLDLQNQIEFVKAGDERGLLGLAFHPEFELNGHLYVYYSQKDTSDSIVARFTAPDPAVNFVDLSTELILLQVAQPTAVHQGGQLAFDENGLLYISFGDGGPQKDANGNGQNTSTLLGSILRIDVDNTEGALNYAIPQGNPFKGTLGSEREEIFAWGFRNPWRFSFDSMTGDLWAGDVGQGTIEEINLVKVGKNYGWNIKEGSQCFENSTCDSTALVDPVIEYTHSEGFSVTGGRVYHGSSAPALEGRYLYADFVTGKIWAARYDGTLATTQLLFDTENVISAFGVDEGGETYFLDYVDGQIYQFSQSGE